MMVDKLVKRGCNNTPPPSSKKFVDQPMSLGSKDMSFRFCGALAFHALFQVFLALYGSFLNSRIEKKKKPGKNTQTDSKK